jgi:hypothetical protein
VHQLVNKKNFNNVRMQQQQQQQHCATVEINLKHVQNLN